MKQKKKGFIFVETIVVISIILGSLIAMYSLYISSNNTTSRRLRFDDVNKLYETYYIKKYLSSFNLMNLINNMKLGSKYERIYRGRAELFGSSTTSESAFFENLWEELHIVNMVLFPYDVSDFVKCEKPETEGICSDKNMVAYLGTLDNGGYNGYRLVIEFAQTMDGRACPNNNECFYFYTNVKVGG